MSKGNSGLFFGTLGTTFLNASRTNETYADRGIDVPESIKRTLLKLKRKGDMVTGTKDSFSMKDVSIMSKETGVEFARITIGSRTYLIRGDEKGAYISPKLKSMLAKKGGTLDFHSHPHDNDCVPSVADRKMIESLKKTTGQKHSKIVTPNGITVTFNEHGVVETGNVSNIIDNDAKEIYMKLFGGK